MYLHLAWISGLWYLLAELKLLQIVFIIIYYECVSNIVTNDNAYVCIRRYAFIKMRFL